MKIRRLIYIYTPTTYIFLLGQLKLFYNYRCFACLFLTISFYIYMKCWPCNISYIDAHSKKQKFEYNKFKTFRKKNRKTGKI